MIAHILVQWPNLAFNISTHSYILLKRKFSFYEVSHEQTDKRTNSGYTEAVLQNSMTLSSLTLPNRQTDRQTDFTRVAA